MPDPLRALSLAQHRVSHLWAPWSQRLRRRPGPRKTLYTFYPCNIDGSALLAETHELGGDHLTSEHAMSVLAEHPGCAYVAVWDGERPVLARYRRPSDRAACIG